MVFIRNKKKYIQNNYLHIDSSKSPFLKILTHRYTSHSFINNIKKYNFLEAKDFISSGFKEEINLIILTEFFNDEYLYRYLEKVSFKNNKSEKINAFLIMDKNFKFKGIINFYMINEPDHISKWKIYKITKETTF